MKRVSIVFTILLLVFIEAAFFAISFFKFPLSFIFIGIVPVFFSIIWHIIFDKKSEVDIKNIEKKSTKNEKTIDAIVRVLGNMKTSTKEINGRVSSSLDTALIAGGQIGESIRSIEDKNHLLYKQLSNASSFSGQITAIVTGYSEKLEQQEQAIARTSTAVEEIDANVHSVKNITKQKTEALKELKGQKHLTSEQDREEELRIN